MAFPLTQEQRQVVENRGGALLVSAAAGSGKTRVLVERLLDRVVNEGYNIDQFLVITYTRAAAAELRARIADELNQRLAQRPGDRHLRRQLGLVYHAQISTVHAFCAQLLRECGHLLDLEPDFRLCDEQEGGMLRLQVLDEVLERQYEQLTPESDFCQLVDTLSAGRDDSVLMQIVLDIYDKIQSHPDPDHWLTQQLAAYELGGVDDAAQTPWGRLLLDDAVSQVRHWRGRMEECLALTDAEEGLAQNYGPSVAGTLTSLDEFLAGAAEGWDGAARALPIRFPTAGRKKMADSPEAERVKAIRSDCKAQMEKLADQFSDSSAQLLADLRSVTGAVRGLFALVREFSAAFQAEKRRRSILDFSDLEHESVRLLTGEDPHRPSETALDWSRRYVEIMVDEYQDTNEVQNAIFSALSREGQNLFLVGDVKQSIYRFRLADPTIFLEKYRAFPFAGQAGEGQARKLLLTRNFRSRAEILSAVNDVFNNIMSTKLGEMEYTADEMLYPGAEYPPAQRPCVELTVLDLQGEPDGEESEGGRTDRNLIEARYAARRIARLLEGEGQVTESGALRPVRPEDIVILLRSPGSVLHHYARALNEQGISWQAEGDRDFFAATEVNVALSLLQVVDNPRQDVALISVLRSPVYGFTADRLAQLRAESAGDFYAAVECAAQRGEADCVEFLERLERMRFGAGELSAHELVWQIYERTGLLSLFGAMSDGEQRRANLITLYELARACETSGHKGLFGFLHYLERLRAAGGRVSVPAKARGGAVRIMSIHKSKGLEFPVVLLCGLSKRFNREDINKPVLFHPKLGVGPKWLDRERMIQSPTLARRGVARQLLHEMLSEELRLLYVAMTRARETLIMTCTVPDCGKTLSKLAEDAGCPVAAQALLSRESVAQWLLLSAMCRPEAGALRPAGTAAVPVEGFGAPWEIRVLSAGDYEQPARREVVLTQQTPRGWDLTGLEERLTWRYPYAECCEIPSKLTATELKGRLPDEEAAQQARPAPVWHTGGSRGLRRPRFAQETLGLTPAQKGTALHLVMQYLDFAQTGTQEQLRGEIDRLVNMALITPQQGQAVSVERLISFFRSPLGQRVSRGDGVHREFKFSILVPAEDYYVNCKAGEQVLLQGVVDCWLEEPDGITILDFKTDRVMEQSLAARAEEYRGQLGAYRRAMEEITGRPVKRQILWFFQLDREVEL